MSLRCLLSSLNIKINHIENYLDLKVISMLRGIAIQAGAEGTSALETAMTEVCRPAPLIMEGTVGRKPGIWVG